MIRFTLRQVRGSLVLVAAALCFCPAAATAEDPEVPGAPHLLPEDALAYIRIDSVENLREAMADSSVGRMFADPKLKPFVSDLYATLAELFEQVGAQLGVSLDELLAIPSGQVSAAAMPGNISERDQELIELDSQDESPEAIRRRIARKRRQQNSIGGLFLIEAGENVDDLLVLVDRLEQQLISIGYVRRTSDIGGTRLVKLLPPRSGRPEIEYFERQDTVVLGIGHQTAAKALDHWLDRSEESTLANRADFTAVMSRCVGAEDTRPQVTFFLDPYHFVERLVKRGGAAALVWPLIEELGVSKIRGIGGSAFNGGEIFEDITHLHVLIDPPRDGFFGVLRPETGPSNPPNFVPADVTSYTSLYWDFETTYDNVDKVLEKFQGAEPLKRFIEDPLKKAIGVSVRDDVLAKLTGRYVTLRWIEPPVKLNSQTQLHAFEITDSLAAKDVLTRIRDRRPNDMQVETIQGHVVYFGRRANRRNMPDAMRSPEPCVMVLGNWVLMSDSRKLIERAAMAHRDAIPRLITVPEYELVSSELGGKLDGEQPFMVSFLRAADYIKQMYDLAQSPDAKKFLRRAGENNPVAAKIVALMERNELPPFKEFEQYFAPSGSFAYDEPSGMHLGSFTLRADE